MSFKSAPSLATPLSSLPRWFSALHTSAEPQLIETEVSSQFQIPSIQIIGLPSREVAESKDRVRSAILASGYELPHKRITVNLSPAGTLKRGTGIELGTALAILSHAYADQMDPEHIASWLCLGELSLSGQVRSTGYLYRTLWLAKQSALGRVLLPEEVRELSIRYVFELWPDSHERPLLLFVRTLQEAWEKLCSDVPLEKIRIQKAASLLEKTEITPASEGLAPSPYLARTLGAALVGKHHCLLAGPKGAGKTHALKWISQFVPALRTEQLEHQRILSELVSQNSPLGLDTRAPVRVVPPDVRPAGLIGRFDSRGLVPGALALADGGILVADELGEWSRDARETLRGPLEEQVLRVVRAEGNLELPAQFQFMATTNLCPCGGVPPALNTADHSRCRCSSGERDRYLKRLSGPLLDRIDFCVLVLKAQPSSPSAKQTTFEPSSSFSERFERALDLIKKNELGAPGIWGANQTETHIAAWSKSTNSSDQNFQSLTERLSLRGRHKVARVAQSLALWDGLCMPESSHFQEAIRLRPESWLES